MIKLSKLITDFKEVIQYCRDYYWFYYVIDGDEFHSSLNTNFKILLRGYRVTDPIWAKEVDRVTKARQRAHRLDLIFNGE